MREERKRGNVHVRESTQAFPEWKEISKQRNIKTRHEMYVQGRAWARRSSLLLLFFYYLSPKISSAGDLQPVDTDKHSLAMLDSKFLI